jgi:phosphoglycolate phosphatase-like HAD superfamily hydrolase
MDEQLIMLLKELVERVKNIETTVFDDDNVLMKSGLVKVESARPSIQKAGRVPDADTIAKMDWADIDEMVVRLAGE